MEIQMNISKEQRKEAAHKIAELVGDEVIYLGVPSCGYQIGEFTIDKDCVLKFSDRTDSKIFETVLQGLDELGFEFAPPENQLTVEMPADFFDERTFANLDRLIENKRELFTHAFATDSLDYNVSEDKVEFPWFTLTEGDESAPYCEFISALCKMAKESKRINAKPCITDNEKYTMRCFLLRLGFIGAEYKKLRKTILKNLTGSSAFRHGKEEADNENSDTATA